MKSGCSRTNRCGMGGREEEARDIMQFICELCEGWGMWAAAKPNEQLTPVIGWVRPKTMVVGKMCLPLGYVVGKRLCLCTFLLQGAQVPASLGGSSHGGPSSLACLQAFVPLAISHSSSGPSVCHTYT